MVAIQLPTTLQPYFDKGFQAYTQGSYAYAVDLLTFVVRHAPDATEARRYLRLATQQQASHFPPAPLTQFATTLLSVPVGCWALACSLRGDHRRAMTLYERLLCIHPRSRWLLLRLADSLSHVGLEAAALAIYDELLSLEPNYLKALRHLAHLAMKRGLEAKARQCFERILTVVPTDLEAQQSLRNLDALGTIKKGFSAS